MCKNFIVIYIIFHLAYPTLRKESFGVILTMSGFINCEVVNNISILHTFWICFSAFTFVVSIQFFFLLFLGNKSVVFHDVGFLDADVGLGSIIKPCFSAGLGFTIFIWPLHGILFRIFFQYFTFLRGMYGSMQQACFICTSCLISCRDFIFCLSITSADLLEVGRLVGFL